MLKKRLEDIKSANYILLLTYLGIFFYCILSEPIYSHDTFSYLRAMPYRQMGYVIFLKTLSAIFGSFFEIVVVGVHAAMSLFSVHYFFKKVSKIFQLNIILQILLLIVLVFPLFPPLRIANNLVSEGLGYGLYLLFIALGIEIIFNKKHKSITYLAITYLVLVTIRSQFIISTLIFAGTYFLIHRKSWLQRKHIFSLVIFCGIILISSLTERTYHLLKDGFFKPTPLGYTSASTAPIYLSQKSDYKLILDKDYQEILRRSYDTLVQKDLLKKPDYSTKEAYKFFHDNLPKICNQTVRQQGTDYYLNNQRPDDWDANKISAYAYFETEAACKEYTKVLILNNFQQWLKFYYANITYGFKSQLLLWFVVVMFVFSFIRVLIDFKKKYGIVFLLSSLILSNAMFIAFASHSIQRYLFYNYALIFLLFLSTYNLVKRESKA